MYIANNPITIDNNKKLSFSALPKKYRVVDNYLIRGPRPTICDIFKLKKEGVNKIYDFRHNGIRGFKWLERLTCNVAGIKYIRKPYSFIEGTFPSKDDYQYVASEVKTNGENGGKTLFHCNSGTHRTSLFTSFYEITKGNSLENCKKNPDFSEKVDKIIENQILNMGYFSRNKVSVVTQNPIKKAKNIFNNLVTYGINKAYNAFLKILEL